MDCFSLGVLHLCITGSCHRVRQLADMYRTFAYLTELEGAHVVIKFILLSLQHFLDASSVQSPNCNHPSSEFSKIATSFDDFCCTCVPYGLLLRKYIFFTSTSICLKYIGFRRKLYSTTIAENLHHLP